MKKSKSTKIPNSLVQQIKLTASLACLSMMREEGCLEDEIEYFGLQHKIKEMYRKRGASTSRYDGYIR